MEYNLDAMDRNTLHDFWCEYDRCSWQRAAKLFPEQPAGYVKAARELSDYAFHKEAAMKHRLGGFVANAMRYEDVCDRIYNALPEFARW